MGAGSTSPYRRKARYGEASVGEERPWRSSGSPGAKDGLGMGDNAKTLAPPVRGREEEGVPFFRSGGRNGSPGLGFGLWPMCERLEERRAKRRLDEPKRGNETLRFF